MKRGMNPVSSNDQGREKDKKNKEMWLLSSSSLFSLFFPLLPFSLLLHMLSLPFHCLYWLSINDPWNAISFAKDKKKRDAFLSFALFWYFFPLLSLLFLPNHSSSLKRLFLCSFPVEERDFTRKQRESRESGQENKWQKESPKRNRRTHSSSSSFSWERIEVKRRRVWSHNWSFVSIDLL